jgi:hypothetical protein
MKFESILIGPAVLLAIGLGLVGTNLAHRRIWTGQILSEPRNPRAA